MTSTPSWSARTASSTICRIAAAYETRPPESSSGTSPKLSRPNSRSGMGGLPCQQLPDARGDLAAEQFDRARAGFARQVHDVVLEVEAAQAQIPCHLGHL